MKFYSLSHNIPSKTIDGNNISEVFRVAKKAIEFLRDGSGPFFIEAVTYRWRGHVGPDENMDVGLRREEDLHTWKKRDPIGRLEKRNKKLMRVLETKGINDKHTEELKLSLEKDYVRKFWVGFKG